MSTRFYICSHCGNIVEKVKDVGVPVVCCGEKMKELVPNSVEASGEKHVPVVTIEGDKLTVNVGSIDHPMEEKHYIEWVHVDLENGSLRKALKPGSNPNVEFNLGGEKAVAVFAYCNLHGLWKAEL
ncbi:MAG: desulfoferrodoxin [Clostridia bacterium]|nr:desulfoferrodoxin [Clostridia bacterium]